MSETAQTLIKAAYRVIGVIATGETPTSDEMADGLESLKFMLRHWSDKNIRIPYITQDTLTLTGATSYTIGSGGNISTARPVAIRGAYVKDSNGFDSPIEIIQEDQYRNLKIKTLTGTIEYLWYSPEFPLGKIYVYPAGGSTLYLDTLKPLTEPTVITSSISFPPGYDDAIKWNLAVRLAPEFGKEASSTVVALAAASIGDIETRNFAEQINPAELDMIGIPGRWHIDEG